MLGDERLKNERGRGRPAADGGGSSIRGPRTRQISETQGVPLVLSGTSPGFLEAFACSISPESAWGGWPCTKSRRRPVAQREGMKREPIEAAAPSPETFRAFRENRIPLPLVSAPHFSIALP